MVIGWARLTMLVELDLNQATVGFAGMRTGYMRSLVEAGHTIQILTPMGKKSIESWEHVQAGKDPVELGPWDCSWFKSVEYTPDQTAEGCDLLIVESSATQWMFGCNTTGQPAIRRCVDILNSYSGKVVIEQSDPDLPFPFGKLGMAERPWSHEENPYRLKNENGHPELERYGWANPEEIWDNKQYYVCVRASNAESLMDDGLCNGLRFQYKNANQQHSVQFVSMPQTYDFNNHNIKLMSETPKEYDLIYTGFPRSDTREKRFDKLFMGMADYIIKAVSGPWETNKREHKIYDLILGCTEWVGNLPWADLPVFISKSRFSLFLGVSKSYHLNWYTNKPFESISSNAVLLYDDMPYLIEIFGERFVVRENNLAYWSRFMAEITEEDRQYLAGWQLSKIKKYNWHFYIRKLSKAIDIELAKKKKEVKESVEYTEAHVDEIFTKYLATEGEYYPPLDRLNRFLELKKKFQEKARKEYNPPKCFSKEYQETSNFCSMVCPFKEACVVAMAQAAAAQGTQEPSQDTQAKGQETTTESVVKPSEAVPQTVSSDSAQVVNIQQEPCTSKVVIELTANMAEVKILVPGGITIVIRK